MSVETLLPAGVAVLLLGDGARPGWWPVAVAGFTLSTVCATVLSLNRGRPVAVGAATAGQLAAAVPLSARMWDATTSVPEPADRPSAAVGAGRDGDGAAVPRGATVVARPSSIGFSGPRVPPTPGPVPATAERQSPVPA
jgi:hypothetical protein